MARRTHGYLVIRGGGGRPPVSRGSRIRVGQRGPGRAKSPPAGGACPTPPPGSTSGSGAGGGGDSSDGPWGGGRAPRPRVLLCKLGAFPRARKFTWLIPRAPISFPRSPSSRERVLEIWPGNWLGLPGPRSPLPMPGLGGPDNLPIPQPSTPLSRPTLPVINVEVRA